MKGEIYISIVFRVYSVSYSYKNTSACYDKNPCVRTYIF